MFCRAVKLSINFKAQVLNVTGTSKKKKKLKRKGNLVFVFGSVLQLAKYELYVQIVF